MTGVINGNASGVWREAEGTTVTVLEYKPNGRAVLVKMPHDTGFKPGRKCWIAAGWVDTAAAGNATCLGDLVGDDTVAELRKPKKGRA